MLTKDRAVCIRAVDFSETSQVVALFTRDNGKISAIAKGSKRAKSAFDGPIEMLSIGRVIFTDTKGDKLSTLTEFQQQADFSNLTRSMLLMNSALFGAELVNSLTEEHDPNPELFDNLVDFLTNVSKAKSKIEVMLLLIVFQLSLLRHIGLRPIMDQCVNCKNSSIEKWSEVYFSSSANGIVCRDCESSFADKKMLSKEAARCLSKPRDLTEAKESTIVEIEKLLIEHLTDILDKPPKMAKYILQC